MKTFTKRLALVCGLLLAAMLCMGIVYIDFTSVFWKTESGVVKLVVSNAMTIITVQTNTGFFGIHSNNTARSVTIAGLKPRTNDTGNGITANVTGGINLTAGSGGNTREGDNALGGSGGNVSINGGLGGSAIAATNDAIGGAGGNVTLTAGAGGAQNTTATNSSSGGPGGQFQMTSGTAGVPTAAATNTFGGAGGNFVAAASQGGTPSAGMFRMGGNGGNLSFSAGSGGNSTRTNSGDGGTVAFQAGAAGTVNTAPGTPGKAGDIEFIAGNGTTGITNGNGGNVYATGGTGAISGNIILGVTALGAVRGNVGVRTNNPQATLHIAGDIAMTGNALPAYLAASPTNNVQTTNWLGRVHSAAAAVLEAAFNQYSELIVTNRIAAATTIVLTNGSTGYAEMRLTVLGEISGGTSRTVTLVANTGQLIANLDIFGTALATSYAFTLTNGNAVTISDDIRQLNGTNVHMIVSRQFAF